MQIGVAYSDASQQQVWLTLEVAEGTTVAGAIEKSGVLKLFPSIDLDSQKVGIFGRLVKLDTELKAGDRVEIHRSITCDPQSVPRRAGESDDD